MCENNEADDESLRVRTRASEKAMGIAHEKHLLPYGSRSLDPAIRLVDRAREIEQAGQMLQGQLHGKLALIQRQIRQLQKEAQEILKDSERQMELHQIPCAFEKKIGQTIYLYQKTPTESYFSLLSPEDWGHNPPHAFLGAYVLRADHTFEKRESS